MVSIYHVVNVYSYVQFTINKHLTMDANTYKEKQERIPFQEDVNIHFFFPGAQRKELVDDVLTALHDEVTFLSITGEEGTGKTMICRIVEKEISDRNLCVYVPENIESFEDVIGVFLKTVGLNNEVRDKEIEDQEKDLSLILREKNQRLVVIFDNAEQMYLAMLERLRKLLDGMNGEETLLQIILSGRRVLYENLEQLEICEFKEIEEIHFHLSPLEQPETHAYLNHCAKLRSRELGKCMFSSEAAKKIYSLSKGNLKVANMLAAKAIASADAEESFVVHPKNVIVDDSPAFSGKGRLRFFKRLSAISKRNWLIAGAGLVILVIVLFVFLGGEDKQQEKIALPNQQDNAVSISTHQDQAADSSKEKQPQFGNQNRSAGQDGIADQEKESLFVVKQANVNPEAKQTEKELSASTEAAEKKPDNSSSLSGKNTDQTKEQQNDKGAGAAPGNADNDAAKNTITDEPKSNEAPGMVEEVGGLATVNSGEIQSGSQHDNQGNTSGTKTSTGQVVVSQLTVEEHMAKSGADVAQVQGESTRQQKTVDGENERTDQELSRDSKSTVEEADSPILSDSSKAVPLRLASIAEPKQIPRIAPIKFSSSSANESLKPKENLAPDLPAGILYQQRALAGKQLLLQEQGDFRTIQLMALTTGKAEENLQKRFTRKEYRTIAKDLYIVKSTDNSKVFVYYGKFADEDAAQQARTTLPQFLLKNSPYVISLEEARRKTNLNQ